MLSIAEQAKAHGIPVFMKEDLLPIMGDGKEMKISGGRNPVEIANGRANETTKWYFPDDNDGLIKVDSNP